MANEILTNEVLKFLKKLEKNNNREWFDENKTVFKAYEKEVKELYGSILDGLRSTDEIEKLKMFRIYRDVRFSKDKTPYKIHFAGSFSRTGAKLRGGYYIRIKPGDSFIAAGFWDPNKEDLFRIRKELELDAAEFRAVIGESSFKKIWGDITGDELKTAPKGFDKAHSNIDLIRKKQFIFVRKFSDKEILSPDFIKNVTNSFIAIRPYFDLMSDILTTDLNGTSLLD
ncbi:DUF2461 domain-containing protein [Cellulophaga sp. E16_2]|uniref:TIGR02453 family protein n=1 Tax=Cellulophaga algicola (strain DSM 14237 / IC166 / ACAM 630) TaxID=688270 RepID=E6XEP7_CELAD|nr:MULTISPECIES: DUF2461 domain-containing protein [Cellulophaga]ADV51375.1 Conserved hypothetical protein CHP02453 [Cellulophaga algicola DSM 14237]MBO0593749.1 DUF2461 domain-containing protein [Cellulophaga sp. E16_2]